MSITVNSEKVVKQVFNAIVAGFRGKVAFKNRTLGVPGRDESMC